MTTNIHPHRDGDRHLRPAAYYALAVLAGSIGLSASYVTVQLFAASIELTEQGPARELLAMAATLFVAAELAAFFIAGVVPVRRLRSLRWQLVACAIALVGFEAVSIYGTRVAMAKAADAHADAGAGRAAQLRASIDANRRSAAALVEAGQRSSQSAIASSRADGAQSIRDAAAMEADTRRMAAELAQVEAGRTPTATAVFGEAGVIAMAVAQSLLVSSIGLLFLGAAGALARAARDARGTAPTATPATAVVATPQAQATPKGATAAVPTWRRYALPASAIAAGAGLVAMAPTPAQAVEAPMQTQETATPDAPTTDVSTTLHPSVVTPLHPSVVTTLQAGSTALATAQVDDAPAQSTTPTRKARRTAAPRAAAMRDTGVGEDDGARFLRVKEGIEAGHIKPSIRAIYSAEGASQQVARRYLLALEQAGIIELAGQGKGYRLRTA